MPSAPARVRSPRSWTLRSKIVASMIALFLTISIGTGTMLVLATRNYLGHQLDDDLRQASARLDSGPGRGPGGLDPDGDHHGPLTGAGGTALRLAVKDGDVVRDYQGYPINTVPSGDTTTALSSTQITLLTGAATGSKPVTVNLGDGLGSYRVVTAQQSGATVYTGLSTSGITQTTNQLLGLVIATSLLGLVLVGTGGTYAVRRNLEPLSRVAATARRVSHLSLDSGDVAVAERVSARDTDPNTEVGQVGLALNSMLDNVDGALRARQESETRVRQFVADASHELRTPLASIRGYAELSRKEPQAVPGTVTHALGRIESESLRMQGLVEDLLLLARLDAGRPLDHDPVDLTLMAIDAVSDARAAAPGHIWELDLPDEPVEITGDAARLHQVLANLLANARTHTPPGTRVTTLIRPGSPEDPARSDVITLAVRDDGPGIPQSLQRNVFERFTRGDEARNRASGSTGLGLSIVAAVTSAHAGRVGVRSQPGETTFLVELPVAG